MNKYIIKLTKTVERYVVVEAHDLEEADRKLQANDIWSENIREKSNCAYGEWGWSGNDSDCVVVDGGETIITCKEDFALWFGEEDIAVVQRRMYKDTDCGMSFETFDDHVTLYGYVEGSESDYVPERELYFPFTGSKLEKAMQDIEKESEEEWHRWNDRRYHYYVTLQKSPEQFSYDAVMFASYNEDDAFEYAKGKSLGVNQVVYVHVFDEVDVEWCEPDWEETFTFVNGKEK